MKVAAHPEQSSARSGKVNSFADSMVKILRLVGVLESCEVRSIEPKAAGCRP
jgi:hypothetical protein